MDRDRQADRIGSRQHYAERRALQLGLSTITYRSVFTLFFRYKKVLPSHSIIHLSVTVLPICPQKFTSNVVPRGFTISSHTRLVLLNTHLSDLPARSHSFTNYLSLTLNNYNSSHSFTHLPLKVLPISPTWFYPFVPQYFTHS